MKKLSKIGLLLLSLALLCTVIVLSVSGVEEKTGLVSYIDEEGITQEGTLAEAWQYAANDSVITLLGNCTLEEGLVLTEKNLTVNIGKFTFTSVDVSAFDLKEGTSLTVIGEGKIVLDGMLATSKSENVNFVIEGKAGTKGIDIVHTGFASHRIVYAEYGKWTFKNLDVYSDATGKQWNCFFEMRNVTTTDVDFEFDKVRVEYDTPYLSHPGQFITNVAGTGYLLIKNSAFITEHSGIKSGVAENPGEEVIRIENSLISCVTDNVSVDSKKAREDGTAPSARNYAILGMNDKFEGSPKQIINIYNSHLEANYRTICFENKSGDITENVANIYDSTLKCIGLNGNDTSENISRAIMLNFYGNSAVITRKAAMAGSTGTKQPFAVINPGFRTNVVGITTALKDSDGVKVLEGTITVTENGIEKTEPNYVFACESAKYAWVYDPVGNADAPYLLVERSYSGEGEEKVETTFDNYPSAYKFAGFDTYQFNDKNIDRYTEYLLYEDGVKKSDWTSYEPFGQTNGTGNPNSGDALQKSKNKMENFHWAQRGGAYYIAGDAQNKYMKYWVKPNPSDPTAQRTTLAVSDAPFWIVGENVASSANDYTYVKTKVYGEERKAVMVIDLDFGTENGVYPDLNLKFASRYVSGTKYDNNAQPGTNWFEIRNGGTVKNNLGTTGTNLTSVPTPVLKGANEWNHLSIVFYTDPNYVGGLGYVYLNGELMGTQKFSTSTDATLYLQGLRFDIPTGQIANSILCIDNMSLRCYDNYQVEGEADGAEKSPESYIIANAPGVYINETLAVVGNSYRGAGIEELQKIAKELGTVIRLQDDFAGTIDLNCDVYTNGYSMSLTENSYSANIIYDANTGNSLYKFNEVYNNLNVNYYWYIGEYGNAEQMKDDSYYVKTVVAPGQVPVYTGAAIPSVKDVTNFVQKIHCGWHSAGDDTTVDTLSAVTISQAISQAGAPIYMYPSYTYEVPTAYKKNASGIVDIAYGSYEASELFTSLKDGETFVLCDNIQFADALVNHKFGADKATYGGQYDYDGDGILEPIRTSNSSKMEVFDYSAEELAAMREASAKMALDLNGYTITIGHAAKRGTLAALNGNVTFSVYSSQPGGMIYSAQGESGSTSINGNRILEIYSGSENGPGSFENSNSHLVVGTVEVDGEVIPGSNLTLYGCVLIEGRNGDDTCTIEVDGIRAIRHNPDSTGAFMTRYYSGTMIVTNTTIIAPTSTTVISVKDYDASAYKMTPEVRFENCVILNDGKSNIFEHTGDDESAVCITLKNVITNGKIATTSNRGKVLIEGGVYAQSIDKDKTNVTTYATGVSQAKYNQAMTLGNLSDNGIFEVLVPKKTDNATMVLDARRIVYVEAGKEHLAPTGDNVEIIVLPVLAVATGTASEIVTVTFMGLDNNSVLTESFVKGGLPTAPQVSDYKLSEFTTLVFAGEFDKKVGAVDANTIFYPTYNVVNHIAGVKSSVSFSTSFNINIYVPYSYKEYFKRANVNGTYLTVKEVTVDGAQYIMCTAPITPNNFAEEIEFVLELDEMYGGVVYKGSTTVSTSVMSYAEEILSDETYTDDEKQLVYAALVYANEVIAYANTEADVIVNALVEKYAEFAGDEIADKYAGAYDVTNLEAAFLKATVRLNSVPTIVFTTLRGFVGTVTITIGTDVREYIVNSNADRTIILDGLTLSEITSDIKVTAEGRVGTTTSVLITDGQYNLATYAKYHVENGGYAEDDIPTDAQIASRNALKLIDAMYLYANAAKAYVAE